MSVGLGLLNCLLAEQRGLSPLLDVGIDDSFFEKEELKVYRFLENHLLKFGVLPKLSTVVEETEVKFQEFPSEPIGYWIDGLRRRHKSNLVTEALKSLRTQVLEGDFEQVESTARNLLMDLEHGSGDRRMVTLSDAAPEVLAAHNARQRSASFSGIPFGIEYLDALSDGAQPGDSIALVGRPSVGKSYFLLNMANHAYDASEVPLVVSLEMSILQCARRLLALRSRLSATAIRLGRLSYWGRRTMADNIAELAEMGDRPFYLVQLPFNATVEDIFVKVKELRPTVLYVDGAYLLRSKSRNQARWERVTETAEFLKVIAAEFNIPTISTYQFNRKGPGLANIGYSDAIAQLASIVIGIDDEQSTGARSWTARQFKTATLYKGREGERGKIRMLYDMDLMIIRQEEVLSGHEEDSRMDNRGYDEEDD